MLIIDDSMFKLAKMQEALLKASKLNREENLNNYKKTVIQIDEKAYADILEEIKQIDEHNQTLEEELTFLEKIKQIYEQLLELQLNFKRVCDTYGDDNLQLSDLSLLNIDYIENRINAINGYLLNVKNIEANKEKLQTLNDELIDEEKKKIFLDKRLSELEEILKNSFLHTEGRYALDGRLVPTSVLLEYQNLELNAEELMDNESLLEQKLILAEKEKSEITEKLRTAEICYNSMLNSESRQILDEIKKDETKAKYRLTMLKILKLVSKKYNNYDEVLKKREDLLELIKYRLICLEPLGARVSIDPFSRTKVKEQLEIILSLTDNTKTVNNIMRQIGELNSRTEQMISQNTHYLISLNDTRSLIENKMSMNDIDITSIDTMIDSVSSKKRKEISPNQIIKIRNIGRNLNMHIVGQKTDKVIQRVCQMLCKPVNSDKPKQETIIPELVIMPSTSMVENNIDYIQLDNQQNFETEILSEDETDFEEEILNFDDEISDELEEMNDVEEVVENNLFETTIPFSEPILFTDKSEENEDTEELLIEPLPILELPSQEPVQLSESKIDVTNIEEVEEMPDAFWVTHETNSQMQSFDENTDLSFDDQIAKLLSTEDNSKTRKKVA